MTKKKDEHIEDVDTINVREKMTCGGFVYNFYYHCFSCCWYVRENEGLGVCYNCKNPERKPCTYSCGSYVSRQQMRHYMAVLLAHIRWREDDMYIHYSPDGDEAVEAMKFAFKYMKVFSKL